MPALCFGPFKLDTLAGELRRRGRVVPLGPQPMKLLVLLATRAGEVVTRETVERELWPDGICVDVEHGINTCISQIRRALGDRAGKPRFVETLPRRGYRFIASVSRAQRRNVSNPRRRMIGREDILSSLEADYGRVVAQRRGQMVCVAGEPGIGKTTVCEAFAATVRSRRDAIPIIGRGRCSERLAGTEAYLPWLEAFENLIEDDPAGDVDRLMRSVAPSWYVQVARSPAPADDAPRLISFSQEQMKRELVTFLSGLSARRPVLIWFEDLHWADGSTVDLIAYVGSRLDELPLLLLATYRQTELLMARHPFTAVRLDLEGRGLCRETPLPFLGRDDVGQYLDLEFPGHDFPAAFGDVLHARTEGSPLFVVDSLEYLRAKGRIVPSRRGWTLTGSLPDLEQELLRLLPQLEDPAERDRRELELRMTLGPALMALQFSAERVGDNFARAEALCERFHDPSELTIPLLGLIVFHHVRAEYEESCRLLERLSRLVEPLGDPTLLLRAHNDFGVNLFLMGRLPEARSRLTKGLEIYLREPALHHDRLVRSFGLDAPAIGMAYLAYTDAVEGCPVGAERQIETASAHAQAHPFTSALLLAFALMIRFTWNDAAAVRRRAEALVELCDDHGFVGQSAFGRFFLGWARAEQGEDEAGLALMLEAKQRLIELSNNVFSSLQHLGLASVLRRHGRLAEALAAVQAGEAFVTRSGERIFESEILRVRGLIALDSGDRSGGECALGGALEVARTQGARLFELRAVTALAECCGPGCVKFRDTLERVYASFPEGFDRPDLQRARAALDLRT